MNERKGGRIKDSLDTGLRVATILIAIAGIILGANTYIALTYEPEVDVNLDSQSLDNLTAELENLTLGLGSLGKTWHLTFKGTDGIAGSDLTDPFYIWGEKAMVTWTPLLDQTGTIAYLCPANNAGCSDQSIQPEQAIEYDILAGDLDIGWYIVRIPDSSGYVEAYLYY